MRAVQRKTSMLYDVRRAPRSAAAAVEEAAWAEAGAGAETTDRCGSDEAEAEAKEALSCSRDRGAAGGGMSAKDTLCWREWE